MNTEKNNINNKYDEEDDEKAFEASRKKLSDFVSTHKKLLADVEKSTPLRIVINLILSTQENSYC